MNTFCPRHGNTKCLEWRKDVPFSLSTRSLGVKSWLWPEAVISLFFIVILYWLLFLVSNDRVLKSKSNVVTSAGNNFFVHLLPK